MMWFFSYHHGNAGVAVAIILIVQLIAGPTRAQEQYWTDGAIESPFRYRNCCRERIMTIRHLLALHMLLPRVTLVAGCSSSMPLNSYVMRCIESFQSRRHILARGIPHLSGLCSRISWHRPLIVHFIALSQVLGPRSAVLRRLGSRGSHVPAALPAPGETMMK